MKEEEIRDILEHHGIQFAEHGTICGTIKAGVGAYRNGMGEIMHTMKDHILHINAQGIAILAVDDINGALQEHTLLWIPQKDIIAADVKIKLLHFLFTMETEKGIIQYKLHKNVLASPWHKENLSFLLLHSSSICAKETI